MAKSIIQNEKECFICHTTMSLERHHVFGGAYRSKSERDGLTVYLCHFHHNEPPMGVHHNRHLMDWLRAIGQRAWMERNDATVEDFMHAYGRNYL